MNNKPEYIEFSTLIGEMKKLCGEKRTGNLFINSDDKHVAYITIDNGRFVSCRYRGKKGSEALDLIKDINLGVIRFFEGKVSTVGAAPLPATDEILNTLSRASHAKQGANSDVHQSDVPSELEVDTATIDNIKSSLTKYLGPVAEIYFVDFEAEHGKVRTQFQAIDMVYALAREIDEGVKQQQFIEQAKERLSR